MIQIENITLKDYFKLEDTSEYDFAMKYAFRFTEPNDKLNIGDIMQLSFGLIKDFQYDYSQGLTFDKMVSYICQAANKKTLSNEQLDIICQTANYFKSEIDKLNSYEGELLGYEPTGEEIEAGIEEFNQFGVFNQIDSLACGDITKHDEVRALPYSVCFTKLYKDKLSSEFQKRYNKIINERNK